MEFKTEQELKDFCIANAGKEATGMTSSSGVGAKVTGRIVAYGTTSKTYLILIENKSGQKKDLPDPLPQVPFKKDRWQCVTSPANLGWACVASTVDLVSDQSPQPEAKVEEPKVTTKAEVKTTTKAKSVCDHYVCSGDTFCHIRYAGLKEENYNGQS